MKVHACTVRGVNYCVNIFLLRDKSGVIAEDDKDKKDEGTCYSCQLTALIFLARR